MFKNKSFLGIILARGGSKRLPRKNILELKGKPLIAWTIEAGLKSRCLDKVIVSSDDDEILSIADHYGAETLKRPEYLASDTATSFDAIKHVLKSTEDFDYVVLLQPTSPLRKNYHIDEAIDLLGEKRADAIISVCEVDHSPLWSNKLPANGSLEGFLKKEADNRSQDLDKYYRLNGAIYICEKERMLKENTLFIEHDIYAYIMNRKSSVDIDDEIDFKLAEVIIDHEK
jgi:CMP-N-acetylneuraminic acid synthetase